jgi:UDP-N-acetylmuramate dehydrogenase
MLSISSSLKPLVVEKNKPLKPFSTFGIGGAAKFFIAVQSTEELKRAFLYSKQQKLPVFVLGKGSNLLFDDRGIDGLVILNRICFYLKEALDVTAGSGYSFSLLGSRSAKQGLGGLEFASGIPASVGGAVFMNAGANGAQTADRLISVGFVSDNGEERLYNKQELEFGYRFSSFQKMKGAIAYAKFGLVLSRDAKKGQQAIVSYRKKTQPYGQKSAGCVFRNPPQSSAGALIDQCGLKGLRVGDAEVSEIHANFIVNRGNATASEVLELAEMIQHRVLELTGARLEKEIRVIPYDISR